MSSAGLNGSLDITLLEHIGYIFSWQMYWGCCHFFDKIYCQIYAFTITLACWIHVSYLL